MKKRHVWIYAIGSAIEIQTYVLWIKTHLNSAFWAMLFKTFGNKIMF